LANEAVPADTMAEEDLVEASALPLNKKQRDALLQASLPSATPEKRRASLKR
jgi:ribosome recycling factor